MARPPFTTRAWRRYVLNVKPESHPSLERQFAGRRASGQVMESQMTDQARVGHFFAWTNDLCLCESAIDVKVNYLLYEQTDKRGKVMRWTWVTNLPSFLIDQIQQLCCSSFRRLWKKLGTKAKLWAMIRSLFSVLEFDSMKALYRHLGSLYQLQLE
jgi:hypothetical protein